MLSAINSPIASSFVINLPLQILHKTDDLLVAQTFCASQNTDDVAVNHVVADKVFANNYALHVADNPCAVLSRRADLLRALNALFLHDDGWQNGSTLARKIKNGLHGDRLPINRLLWANQVHGKNVWLDDGNWLNAPTADALLSDRRRVALAILTADCVPIALFDGKRIAVVHAGWQGLAQGILAQTVAKMRQMADVSEPIVKTQDAINGIMGNATNNGQIFAYIGACICGSCYEVPRLLADEILQQAGRFVAQAALTNLQDLVQPSRVEACAGQPTNSCKTDVKKVLLDLPTLTSWQLACLGVVALNTQAVPCSYSGAYHSHRRATHCNTLSGRMALVVAQR